MSTCECGNNRALMQNYQLQVLPYFSLYNALYPQKLGQNASASYEMFPSRPCPPCLPCPISLHRDVAKQRALQL